MACLLKEQAQAAGDHRAIARARVDTAFLTHIAELPTERITTIFAEQLRAFDAVVTSHRDGLLERVPALPGKSPDVVLDVAPVSGALPAQVQIADDPKRIMTIVDFATARTLGVAPTSKSPACVCGTTP